MSKQVNVTMSEKLHQKLEKIAEEEGYTSVPELIREIVRDWLKEYEGREATKKETVLQPQEVTA
ncbi:hypothetical protein DRP04_15830 [Archaeoglobales archaeon]|nr:MAG: hypothetical protein DRP04_15830 [Archaeoglobales archaeon]